MFCFHLILKIGACFFVFNRPVNGLRENWTEMFLFKGSLNHYFVSESRNFPKITLPKIRILMTLKYYYSFKQ